MSKPCTKPYRADGSGGPSRWQLEEAVRRHNPLLKGPYSKKQMCNYVKSHGLTLSAPVFNEEDKVCGAEYDPLRNLHQEALKHMAVEYNEKNPMNKINGVNMKSKIELCHDLRERGQSVKPVSKVVSAEPDFSFLSVPSAPSAFSFMSSPPAPVMTNLQRCAKAYKPMLKNRHVADLRNLAEDYNKAHPDKAHHIKNVSSLAKEALCRELDTFLV